MRYIISLIVVFLVVAQPLFAQPEIMNVRDEGIPIFLCDVGNIASDDPDLSSLKINIKVPYDELQFLKLSDSLYQADIELVIIIHDSDGKQVEGKSFRRKVKANSFDQTNSNRIHYFFKTVIDLPPEKYSLLCEVTDLDSRKTGRRKQDIELRDFSEQELSISDLILLQSNELTQNDIETVHKYFPDILGDNKDYIVASLEVYGTNESAEYEVDYSVRDFRRKKVQEGKYEYPNQGYRTHLNIPLLKENLSFGNYRINLKVKADDEEAKKEQTFRVQITNLPTNVSNLQKAIKQLRYIADDSEIDHIQDAPDSLQEKRFKEFWKEHDPTPGTQSNELMDEYYRRIAFSNAHFSTFQEGWNSDMGMVYVIFGPPNDIERNPYNVSANPYGGREVYAYEYWYYYDINRRFIFVDELGFGNFRLLNPNDVYINR